jgi:hypothetical protein
MSNSISITNNILNLIPTKYGGGIAIWGALKPVYDTSMCPEEEGVHVHARETVGGVKSIDETFMTVNVYETEEDFCKGEVPMFTINGEDASAYNIATILKVSLTYLACPHCNAIHTDHDFNAVHPHTTHICDKCEKIFTSVSPVVSNPIMYLKEMCNDTQQDRIVIDPVDRKFINTQERWKGGIQMWGSNPAILWTSPKPEEGGAHVHAFLEKSQIPTADETYGRVELDGIALDPAQVRFLMAQQSLAYLKENISSLVCPACNNRHFDLGEQALNPHTEHHCENCSEIFTSPSEVVSNPVYSDIQVLYSNYRRINEKQKVAA